MREQLAFSNSFLHRVHTIAWKNLNSTMIRAKVSNMAGLPPFWREIMMWESNLLSQTHFYTGLTQLLEKNWIYSMIRTKVSNMAGLPPFRREITMWESNLLFQTHFYIRFTQLLEKIWALPWSEPKLAIWRFYRRFGGKYRHGRVSLNINMVILYIETISIKKLDQK